MENMILIDLETRDFSVEVGGIYEVGAIAISNGSILEKLHLRIVEDESLISHGYGYGYKELSYNEEIIKEFKLFIEKYKFPLVAHNAPFDRKFLLHFNWIANDYPFYDSIRAIKGENLNLPSYSMEYLMEYYNISKVQSHTALADVEVLFKIIETIKPKVWLPIGSSSKKRRKGKTFYPVLDALKKDFKVEQNIFNGKTIVFTGKSNYFFILIRDGVEFKRYHFEVIFKDTIKYKNNKTNKWTSKVYKIRKCKYNNIFNLILREKKIIDGAEETFIEAYDFKSLDLLKDFFFKRFSKELPLLLF